MTYELARQLKDAGFPQKVDEASGVDKLLGGIPYAPTVTEVIEACGRYFIDIHFWKSTHGPKFDE